jgi:hypothetical protein
MKKITFIDKNKSLVDKIKKAIKFFPEVGIEAKYGDIFNKLGKKIDPEKYNPYQATKLPTKEELKPFIKKTDQVWDQVRNQVRNQVGNQVWDQVRNQVGDQVWNQVGNQVWDQVRNQVGNQVWIR